MKRVITGLAVAAVLILSASACGSSGDGNPIEDEAAADTTTTPEERDTTTTEEPTTEAPTTTTPEPEPSCDELYDEWLAEPVDSPSENEIEAQMADQSCDQLPDLSASSADMDLEGTIDVEQAGDVAASSIDMPEFCSTVDTLGHDLAFAAWSGGFQGAAEPFGFSDLEVFDEVAGRC